jgi:23S rRNA pseudouridine2605 synthase
MPSNHFNRFGKAKSNAQKKEEFRQEKRTARAEKNAYFEKKKAEKSAQQGKPYAAQKIKPTSSSIPPKTATVKRETEGKNEQMPLNKYLAHCGVCSRRDAAEEIRKGLVKVNGQLISEPGHKVTIHDKIIFNGKPLQIQHELVYILLNKPKDCITTTSDEKDRKTVLDLIKSAYTQIKSLKKPRLYPVGRLDRNTSGVLLITNDGELAQNLTHPSREMRKIYHVHLNKNLSIDDLAKIQHGIVLEDGITEVDEIAYTNPKAKNEVGVEIHSGKNRIVRRIFESLGYEVEKLDRVYFGGLTKKDLPRGKWRFLEEEEVRRLKHFIV